MKRIPLRSLTEPRPPIEWREVLTQIIRSPMDKTKGIDIEEMRRSVRVLDALDNANGVLELEDADWEHLKAKTIAMTWGIVDARLLTLYDDVVMAQENVALNDKEA